MRIARVILFGLLRLFLVVGAVMSARIPIIALRGRVIPDAEPIATLVEKTLFLLASILTWWAIAAFIEKRPVSEIGFGDRRRTRHFSLGLVSGTALVSLLVLFYKVVGFYTVIGFQGPGPLEPIMTGLVGIAIVAFFEEILFRALLFRIMEETLGTWVATALVTGLFASTHLGNPHATWMSIAAFTMASSAFCLAFTMTRNIWFVTGLHISWNACEALLFGLPTSGVILPSVIRASLSGPAMWTGGEFGPEGGAVVAALGLALAVTFGVIAVRNGTVVDGPWRPR